jgi:hypothetical protein
MTSQEMCPVFSQENETKIAIAVITTASAASVAITEAGKDFGKFASAASTAVTETSKNFGKFTSAASTAVTEAGKVAKEMKEILIFVKWTTGISVAAAGLCGIYFAFSSLKKKGSR